ncbi:hypothetical protein VC83_01576 [Pseudogymnoascus destructans]|uniref:Uncharacterized protein n=1 Tax=Pseudogymnoascus destructans TaxID=655981 RepID=A0A177AHZ8_9PEZI|nr:uncharacterized protein VC83_01576 [Pseudogymnoascus destructans]OAF61715.1 hypothetical protein VC83_01576 [Pseudogymnoascus destructans]
MATGLVAAVTQLTAKTLARCDGINAQTAPSLPSVSHLARSRGRQFLIAKYFTISKTGYTQWWLFQFGFSSMLSLYFHFLMFGVSLKVLAKGYAGGKMWPFMVLSWWRWC